MKISNVSIHYDIVGGKKKNLFSVTYSEKSLKITDLELLLSRTIHCHYAVTHRRYRQAKGLNSLQSTWEDNYNLQKALEEAPRRCTVLYLAGVLPVPVAPLKRG